MAVINCTETVVVSDKYILLKTAIYNIYEEVYIGNIENLFEDASEKDLKKIHNRLIIYTESPKQFAWDYAKYITRNKKNLFEKTFQSFLLIFN